MTPRPPVLYEELLTRRLEAALREARAAGWRDSVAGLDPAEAPAALARFVHDLIAPLLGSFGGEKAERLAHQLDLVNAEVELLRQRVADSPVLEDDALAPPARQLLALIDSGEHESRVMSRESEPASQLTGITVRRLGGGRLLIPSGTLLLARLPRAPRA